MPDPSTHGTNPPAPPLGRSRLLARYRIVAVIVALLGAVGVAWSVRRAIATSAQIERIGYTELLAHGTAGDVEKAENDGERGVLQLKKGTSAAVVLSQWDLHDT